MSHQVGHDRVYAKDPSEAVPAGGDISGSPGADHVQTGTGGVYEMIERLRDPGFSDNMVHCAMIDTHHMAR